jgi:ABC-type Fe3+/spermidine/putrescine transport system ATPase subunit
MVRVEELLMKINSFTLSLDHLEISPGTLVCLTGPSGAGKTTLLNGIAGFLPLQRGEIWIFGKSVQLLPPEKRGIAYVFQRPALFPHLTISGNIEFGLRLQNRKKEDRQQRVISWLEQLRISELANRSPNQISEGQAQRVALARALAPGFPFLLLDEPFSALDVSLRKELREVLKQLVGATGIAALMVTHHPEDAEAIADRVLVIEKGRAIEL